MKKYSIIYADPPWSYKDKCHSGKRGVGYKYSTMSLTQIQSLPVEDIAADNCVLFLWATMPLLQEALDTIKSWGFTYKTVAFTWVKRNKKKKEGWFWAMGNYTRGNAELCLLAIKGKPKRISAKVQQVIEAPVGRHSAKPPEARDKIVQLMGDLLRIELFARESVEGWDCFGDDPTLLNPINL